MTAPDVVRATLLPTGPGAELDRLLVKSCAFECGHVHVHYVLRGADLTTLVRRPRCNPSRTYRLDVVDVLPAGVRLATA